MGNNDPMLAGPFRVDMVVADAKARHDLEPGQPAHERLVNTAVAARRRDRPDRGPMLGEPCLAVGLEPQPMQREPFGDQFGDQDPCRSQA